MANALQLDYRRYDPETGVLNTMQDQAIRDTTTFILMVEGGAGSGKSYEGCMKSILLSKLNPGIDGGILVPSYPMFRRDLQPLFSEISEANEFEMPFHGGGHYYSFPEWGGAKLWVLSADTQFPGVNLGWGMVNEHSLIPRPQMEEFVNRRVRKRCPHPQIEMVGTPDDRFGYLEDFTKKWEAKNPKNPKEPQKFRLIRGSTRLNAHNLREGYIEDMRASLDPLAFRLWMEGERVRILTDAFYHQYREFNNRKLERQKELVVHVGVDFNVGNMHAVMGHSVGHGKFQQMLWFDEIVLTDYHADTYELARKLKTWNGGKPDGMLLTIDPAGAGRRTTGPSDAKVLEGEGFEVRFKASHPTMRDRQIRANGLLANKRMFVDKDRCPVLHKDLLNCKQDKRTFEKVKDYQGIYTHATDGMDYVLQYEFPDLHLDSPEKFRQGRIYGNV